MAPKPDRLALIFGMVAKLFAEATTKLGLATTVAALRMTAIPFAGAAAAGYPINTIGVTPKSICIGPAWPDMANKNDWQSASMN